MSPMRSWDFKSKNDRFCIETETVSKINTLGHYPVRICVDVPCGRTN
jgi:hypothetical protein